MKLFQELKDRRLFRIVVSAVAGGWVLLEALGSLTEQGVLPHVSYRVGLVWYVAAVAAAAVIGWHHGEKGRQKAPVGEMVLLAVILAVAIGGSVRTVSTFQEPGTQVAAAASEAPEEVTLHRNRVVVAPLKNETSDPSLDALGRMGSDWITEGLHRTGVVEVVPSPMAIQASRYVDGQMELALKEGRLLDPLRAIAEETGAGTVVSGTYYLFGDDVHIQMQVTNALSGTAMDQLEPIVVPRSDPAPGLEQLRNRVMGSLALNLDGRLTGHAAQTENPPAYEAYQAFSRGMDSYTRSDWQESVRYFSEARTLDTAFALPLLYESFARSNLGQTQAADSVVDLLATYAPQLSPHHRAWVRHLEAQFDLDRPAALAAIREAAEMSPGSKASYNAAWLSVINNRPREALEWLDQLEPGRGPMRGWFHYWQIRGEALHMLGEYEGERDVAREARRAFPDYAAGPWLEARALIGLGRTDEATALARAAPAHPGSDRTPSYILLNIASEFEAHGFVDEEQAVLELALQWTQDQLDGNAADNTRRQLLEDRQFALYQLSRYDDAMGALDELVAEYGERDPYKGRRAVLMAWLGRWDQARAAGAALEDLDAPFTRPGYTMQRARIAAITGDADQAASFVVRALREGLQAPMHLDRDFVKVRDDPAFAEVLRPRG
jgi:tetratricopeptide (TPR) repeat protein/TolB-like protein